MPHSPSPVRTQSSKRHSRSHSPRTSRASPAGYYSRSSRADSSSRTAVRSPTPPTPPSRKIDISDKITDTSLFAELVKDRRKRTRVLQEILDKKDEPTVLSSGENSNSATVTINNNDLVDDVDSASGIGQQQPQIQLQPSNGVKDNNTASSRMFLVDIPMPNAAAIADDIAPDANNSTGSELNVQVQLQPPPPPPNEPNAVDSMSPSTKLTPAGCGSASAVINNNKMSNKLSPAAVATISSHSQVRLGKDTPPAEKLTPKPDSDSHATSTTQQRFQTRQSGFGRSLTKLPMPPGVNVAELEVRFPHHHRNDQKNISIFPVYFSNKILRRQVRHAAPVPSVVAVAVRQAN